jgi:IS30 family transposase
MGKAQHRSVRAIAKVTGRSPNTISRELPPNGWQSEAEQCVMGGTRIAGGYDAHWAGKRARRVRRAALPVRNLYRDGPLWAEVRGVLTLKLSPEQIAVKLRLRHSEQPQLQASHETNYTAIYAMPRDELRRDLTVLLRQARADPPSVTRTSAARCRTCCPSTYACPK